VSALMGESMKEASVRRAVIGGKTEWPPALGRSPDRDQGTATVPVRRRSSFFNRPF